MNYLLTIFSIFVLAIISTTILCLMTSFSHFGFLFFSLTLFMNCWLFLYHGIVYYSCKFLDKKYDIR